jgi:hypothetical protein
VTPSKLLLCFLLGAMGAGCGTQKHNGPKPFLAPAREYWPYAHWECPQGYTEIDSGRSGKAWCVPTPDQNKEMEDYERSLTPEGKP